MTRTSFLKIDGKGSASNPAKINSAWAVFKDTVIRCRNPFILYLVAMIIFGPVGLFMEYPNLPGRLAVADTYSLSISLPSLTLLGLLTTVGASIVIPMVIFSYLDNRRAMDTFHALPVTRGKLFWGNICAGLFLLFAPFLLTMPLTAGITDYYDAAFGAKRNQNSFAENFDGQYLQAVLAIAVTALLFYALLSFLMFCCSTVVESVGYFAIIVLGYAALVSMIFQRISETTFGFSSDGVWIHDFLKRFSPLYFFLSANGGRYSQFWLYQLQMVLVAVVFGLLAWRRAVARKSEQAGGFVWLPVYYIAAIGGSLAVGLGAAQVLGYAFSGMMVIVSVLLGVLAYVILDTIRNRGFKNIVRSLIVSAISVAGVAVFSLLVVVTGTFGYEGWLPVEDNIESVVVYDNNLDGFPVSDAENIHRIVSFHQAVLANQNVVEEGLNQPLVEYLAYEFDENQFAYAYGEDSISIEYTMKNGRVITRQYNNVPLTLTRYLYEVVGSEEYTCSIADQLQAASETLPMTAYEYGTEGNWRYEFQLYDRLGICQQNSSTMPLAEQDAKAFIAALAEDFRRRPEGWKTNPDTQPVGQVSFHVLKDYTVAGAVPATYYDLYIYECDLNTLDLLEQFGYYSADEGMMYIGEPYVETVEMTFGIVTPEEYPNPTEYAEGDIFHFSGSRIGYYSEYEEDYYYEELMQYDDELAASDQPTAAVQELTADSNAGELTQVRLYNDAVIDVIRRNFTTEDMNALFDLIKYVGYSDEPLPIVIIDHQTYLIPEENVEAVRELIFG